MRILLTGATGFVGSHILDSLRARGLAVRVLVRASSSRRYLQPHLQHLELCEGNLDNPAALDRALEGVTHVIHCAGTTRARNAAEFYAVNQQGTRHLVAAVNARREHIRRLLHISSLAVSHPATPAAPAREDDPPAPISEYGRSKLGAERAVVEECRVPYTLLRPPPVYGPRDDGFLALFQTVRRHVVPRFCGGVGALSMVFARDLAEAVAICLDHPAAAGRTYFVACPEVVTVQAFCEEIARQLQVWTVPVCLPVRVLWPICALSELGCRLRGRPSLLNRQKYAELRAPGWVCDPGRLRAEIGYVAGTLLAEGIRQAIQWYRAAGWL